MGVAQAGSYSPPQAGNFHMPRVWPKKDKRQKTKKKKKPSTDDNFIIKKMEILIICAPLIPKFVRRHLWSYTQSSLKAKSLVLKIAK